MGTWGKGVLTGQDGALRMYQWEKEVLTGQDGALRMYQCILRAIYFK